MAQNPSALLRSALGINLVFSAGCGLAATLYSPAVAGVVGAVPPWLIFAIGFGLLVFAAGIAWTLLRLRIGQALLISALDLLWVAGTLPLTLVPGLFTLEGLALVLVLALAVGTLGLLQLAGIRAIFRAGARPGQYRHCIRLRSSADPEKLWRVIRDLGGISRYSAGLRASRLEGGGEVAPGAVRVCTNTRGESWAEEVVSLDDTARSVVFRFRSEADDFPFPLAALSGGWNVMPGSRVGALVDVWWIVTPKQRRFGWLVPALMTIPLDRDLPRIVGAMEAAAMGRREPEMGRRLALGYC